MSVTRELNNISVRIEPVDSTSRTLLPENIVNFNPGEKPEQSTIGDTASISGDVIKVKRLNKSATGITLTIFNMCDDYHYLRELEENLEDCKIIYTNESSDRGGEEYIFQSANFMFPANNFDEETVEITIICTERTYKRI